MILNGNAAHQTAQFVLATGMVSGIQIYGVKNLIIKDCTVIKSSGYAVHLANISDISISNYHVSNNISSSLTDGIHFNGPCDGIVIDTIYTTSGDDNLALNADDGAYSDSAQYYPFPGDITNVDVRNINLVNSNVGIRMLSASSLIDNVRIRGIHGITQNEFCLMDCFLKSDGSIGAMTPGSGNFGRIQLEDINVVLSAVNFSSGEWGTSAIFIEAGITHLSIKDWSIINPAVGPPDAWLFVSGRNGAPPIKFLEMKGVHYHQDTSLVAILPVVLCEGNIDQLNAQIDLHRESAAGLVSSPAIEVKTASTSIGINNLMWRGTCTNIQHIVEVDTPGNINNCHLTGIHSSSGGYGSLYITDGSSVQYYDARHLLTQRELETQGSGQVIHPFSNGSTGPPGPGSANLTLDLAAYYRFDTSPGLLVDSSGNSLALTNTNGVTTTAGKIGTGQAASFTAASSQLLSNTSDSYWSAGGFHRCCWVKFNTVPSGSGNLMRIIGKSELFMLYNNGTSNNFLFNNTYNSSYAATSVSVPSVITTGTWYFVDWGWNGGTTCFIRLNAGTKYTATTPGSFDSASDPMYIGGNPGPGQYLDGAIDGLACYAGINLTDAQINTIYNGGSGYDVV